MFAKVDREEKIAASLVLFVGGIAIAISLSGCGGPPGAKGDTGAQGQAGQNGYSIVSTATQPPAGSCGQNPDGSDISGTIILMAQDAANTGRWESNDPEQTSILVCNGSVGQTGAQGNQGRDGTDATPVSAVQFCAGYTTTYPSSFPEFGLCLGSDLYAVYWDGRNAWLSEVVPGYYASTSTSAPCDFTVKANCQISH